MITIYHYHDYCCILLLLYAIVINSYYCNCSWLLSRLAINAKSWHQVQTAHISYMWFCDPKKSLVVQSSFQVYERTCGSSPHLWRIKRSIKPAGLILVIFGCLIFWICGASPNIRGQRLKKEASDLMDGHCEFAIRTLEDTLRPSIMAGWEMHEREFNGNGKVVWKSSNWMAQFPANHFWVPEGNLFCWIKQC
jgi:hypothetical protein